MVRLLCVLSNMNMGGAETFLMKIYRTLDRTKYQMDFCINVFEKCAYEDEIISFGGKIFRIPPKSKNIYEFKKQLYEIVHDNQYENVLRITSNAAGFWDLKIAKQAGAKKTIARSSNASNGKSIAKSILHRICRVLLMKYVDVKIAPSGLAARHTFGSKAYIQGNVVILRNGLNFNDYQYHQEDRERIREELDLTSDIFVVGHIGRFMQQKNHDFLIDIFRGIKIRRPNSVLLLIGNGELEDEIRKKVDALDLTDSVYFLGTRSDIPAVLSAMDILIFPSLFEGMPNVVVEAQVSGLPCLISDSITKEANITGLVEFLPLSSEAVGWSDAAMKYIHKDRQNTSLLMKQAGYDIKDVAEQFEAYVFNKSR